MEGSRRCEMNPLFVEQFADGELPFKESAEMSAHVAGCAECRARFDATRRLKRVLRATADAERLTIIERGGLEKLIADTAARHRTLRERFADLFTSPYPLVAFSASVALAVLVGVFLHQLFTIERSADLIAREILHIHETTLPDEFSTAGDIETVVKRGLDLPAARIGRLVADRSVTKARFGTIGTRPMASLHMNGPAGNGTLLVARHNDALREVFAGSDCLGADRCHARKRTMGDTDLLFWEEGGGDYLFVSKDRGMMNGMVQLVSAGR